MKVGDFRIEFDRALYQTDPGGEIAIVERHASQHVVGARITRIELEHLLVGLAGRCEVASLKLLVAACHESGGGGSRVAWRSRGSARLRRRSERRLQCRLTLQK